MKKTAIALLLTIVLLCVPAPVLANGFGVSPGSDVKLEVPKDGSATQDFTFTGYNGTVTIGLEGIPLTISPPVDSAVEVTDGETVTVTFYGDGTNNTYEGKITFLASTGETALAGIKVRLTVHVNCTTEVVKPAPTPTPSGDGGGGGVPWYTIKTDLFGKAKTFYTNYQGTVQKTIEATSEDGILNITIPKGTIALDEDGKRLKGLEAAVDESPPDPPEDAHVIGLAYNFGPAGATFDPAITFTWSYDPDALPEGVAEGDLVLAYYDEEAGEWVKLDCVVDTENKIITASVPHFTTFAIIGAVIPPLVVPPPAPPPDPEPPTPPPVPEPPVVTIPEPVPVPAPVVPEPTPVPAPVVPEPTPTAPPGVLPTWALVLIVIGAAAISGLVFWFIKKRERAY